MDTNTDYIVREEPAAYAVMVTYDWPDNQPTSEFVGMYQSKANANEAHLAAVASAKENEFEGLEPEDEQTDGVSPGYYSETRVDYVDGGFTVQTVPLYTSRDKWIVDEGFVPA